MPATQTLGDAKLILSSALRDAALDSYSNDDRVNAINFIVEEFARRTRLIRGKSTATINSGVDTVDIPATITDFAPTRITVLDIDYYPVSVISREEMRRHKLASPTATGRPERIAFETDTSGLLDFVTDQSYTLRVNYFKPHGRVTADTDAMLIPDEHLWGCMWWGVPAALQFAGREDRIAGPKWLGFLDFIRQVKGESPVRSHSFDTEAYV